MPATLGLETKEEKETKTSTKETKSVSAEKKSEKADEEQGALHRRVRL